MLLEMGVGLGVPQRTWITFPSNFKRIIRLQDAGDTSGLCQLVQEVEETGIFQKFLQCYMLSKPGVSRLWEENKQIKNLTILILGKIKKK